MLLGHELMFTDYLGTPRQVQIMQWFAEGFAIVEELEPRDQERPYELIRHIVPFAFH